MFLVVAMLVVALVIAGLVALYVAYPHRGEQVPAAPWLGEAMTRAVDAAPVLEEHEHAESRRSA